MKLENETRKLIKKDKRSPESLAKVSGINMRWLYRFKFDQSNDYGIRRVQKLFNFLTKNHTVFSKGKSYKDVYEALGVDRPTKEQIKEWDKE